MTWHPSPIVNPPASGVPALPFAFDPRTLIQKRRPIETAEDLLGEDVNARYHERHHWHQYCGTSLGQFLLSLDRAQSLGLHFLISESPNDFVCQLEKRAASGGSIIDIDESGNLHPASKAESQIGKLERSWHEILLVRSLFLDANYQWEVCYDRESALINAINKVLGVYKFHGVLTNHLHYDTILNSYMLLPFTSQELAKEIENLRIGEHELTTRSILECGALLNELSFMWGLGFPNDDFQSLIWRRLSSSLESDAYSLCLAIAMSVWNNLIGTSDFLYKFVKVALTLACCCDLSLNPPLPPLYLCMQEPKWRILYPPLRFLALVKAVERVGLIEAESLPSNEYYGKYVEKLCESAKLPNPNTYTFLLSNNPRVSWHCCEMKVEELYNIPLGVFDYIAWVFYSFANYRRESPIMLALSSLSNIASGHDSQSTSRILRKENAWFLAPLYWEEEKLCLSDLISDEFGFYLTYKQIMFNMIFQAFLGNGKFELYEDFPADVITESMIKKYKNDLAHELRSNCFNTWKVT